MMPATTCNGHSTPEKLPSRYFYRCYDCLSIVATDKQIPMGYDRATGKDFPRPECAACGGYIEFMGETKRSSGVLRRINDYRPPCDGRCTNATGPSCDCQCGGEHHGSGRLVAVYEESGIPKVQAPLDAVAKAEEYNRLCDVYEAAYQAKYADVIRRKQNGWIADFDFFLESQDVWGYYRKTRKLRTHKGRNAAIIKLTESLTKRQ